MVVHIQPLFSDPAKKVLTIRTVVRTVSFFCFHRYNYVLKQNGAMMKGGTTVDATIFNASQFHKELGEIQRSRDASDQEGQRMVF